MFEIIEDFYKLFPKSYLDKINNILIEKNITLYNPVIIVHEYYYKTAENPYCHRIDFIWFSDKLNHFIIGLYSNQIKFTDYSNNFIKEVTDKIIEVEINQINKKYV